MNLRLAHKDCNVARNRRDHPFHKAPEITTSGYPDRWHHITLHPDMWRDGFAAKATILAKQREAARIERELQQAEQRARSEAELRSQLATLWQALHADQGTLRDLERTAPKAATTGHTGSPKQFLLGWKWGYRLILGFQAAFIVGGIWLFGWGPLAGPNEVNTLASLLLDAVLLYFASMAFLWVLNLVLHFGTWAVSQTPKAREREAQRAALNAYTSKRNDLTKRIDKTQAEIDRLSHQLP